MSSSRVFDQQRDPQCEGPTLMSDQQRSRLRLLFPALSTAELSDVAEILHGYCAVVWRIYERLKRERPEVIDELMRSRTMKAKVDFSNENQSM